MSSFVSREAEILLQEAEERVKKQRILANNSNGDLLTSSTLKTSEEDEGEFTAVNDLVGLNRLVKSLQGLHLPHPFRVWLYIFPNRFECGFTSSSLVSSVFYRQDKEKSRASN
jgi:hypothetical protein